MPTNDQEFIVAVAMARAELQHIVNDDLTADAFIVAWIADHYPITVLEACAAYKRGQASA